MRLCWVDYFHVQGKCMIILQYFNHLKFLRLCNEWGSFAKKQQQTWQIQCDKLCHLCFFLMHSQQVALSKLATAPNRRWEPWDKNILEGSLRGKETAQCAREFGKASDLNGYCIHTAWWNTRIRASEKLDNSKVRERLVFLTFRTKKLEMHWKA